MIYTGHSPFHDSVQTSHIRVDTVARESHKKGVSMRRLIGVSLVAIVVLMIWRLRTAGPRTNVTNVDRNPIERLRAAVEYSTLSASAQRDVIDQVELEAARP